MALYVAYYRVSTDQQELGIEAQKKTVHAYLASQGGRLDSEFTEIESGKNDSREKLTAALHRCIAYDAVLVIAKLDRLSRSVAFIARLMDSRVRFIACDMPDANHLTVHIMAAVAQAEREAISARTKAALAVAREKGKHLGRHKGCDTKKAWEASRNARASRFAASLEVREKYALYCKLRNARLSKKQICEIMKCTSWWLYRFLQRIKKAGIA